MTDKQKEDAIKAAKNGAINAYKKSEQQPELAWWKKLIWVVLGAAAAAASCLLSGCGQLYAWDELTPQQQQALQAADHAYHEWSGHPTDGVVTIAQGSK